MKAYFWTVLGCLGVASFQAWREEHQKIPKRGDLRLSVIYMGYDRMARKLKCDLKFYNDDSVDRWVVSVSFVHRRSRNDNGFAVYHTGPTNTPFVGDISPLKVKSKSEEYRSYTSHSNPQLFDSAGEEAGLTINFSRPGSPDDKATIMVIETMMSGQLITPSFQMKNINHQSLDSAGELRQHAELVRAPSQRSRGWSPYLEGCIRFFDY